MASIFANATVTIIAKQGEDASYGLRGLRGMSHPRDFPPNILEIEPGFSIVQCRDMQNYDTPQWSKRGWTYQEELFSKRKLIFFYDTIQWKCGCSSFSEDLVTDNPLRRSLHNANMQMAVLSNHFPDFNGYENLVNEYNSWKLTHPEDAILAFAGVLTVLSRSFYGGFICGLPPEVIPPRNFYTHESQPTSHFWYVLPLNHTQPPATQNRDTFLSCRTQRTWLVRAERFGSGFTSIFKIRNSQGMWIGMLQEDIKTVSNEEAEYYARKHRQPSIPTQRFGASILCELVSIFRGYAYQGYPWGPMEASIDDEERLGDVPKGSKGSKYEFYNVLWVEWEDGIAYRKGLGRIVGSAWEVQKLEWIDLILG